MSNKIQIIVFNEHTIGYKDSDSNFFNVFQSCVLKGACYTTRIDDRKYIGKNDHVRLATEKDFSYFYLSSEGFRQDPKYEYDRKN